MVGLTLYDGHASSVKLVEVEVGTPSGVWLATARQRLSHLPRSPSPRSVKAPTGGYGKFLDSGLGGSSATWLPSLMQGAGYSSYFVGKFINGCVRGRGAGHAEPAGEWRTGAWVGREPGARGGGVTAMEVRVSTWAKALLEAWVCRGMAGRPGGLQGGVSGWQGGSGLRTAGRPQAVGRGRGWGTRSAGPAVTALRRA